MIAHLLPNSYTQKRRNRATDSQGGWPEGTPTTVGTVKGRHYNPSGAEITEAEEWVGRIDTVVYVGPGEAIERDDSLTLGSETWRVKWILKPSVAAYQKLLCTIDQAGN